jgi:GDP-L-fucose synthase
MPAPPSKVDSSPAALAGQRIVITGGAGFLGRHVRQALAARGVADANIFTPRRRDFDLTALADCARLYREAFPGHKVDLVLHLAAEVGGIGANRANPGRYFYANMAMALHLIEQARLDGLIERGGKFVQVGTICSYPKFTPVPFREDDLWNGYPEETNAPYGVAKKAAWQMLDAYRLQYGMRSACVLPVNLYGPHDNFDLQTSHVIPALIRKCIEAQDRGEKSITVWGTGTASREFLYVEDAAEGIVRAAEMLDEPIPVNLGAGFEITIKDLVELIVRLTGFKGAIQWDASKPDGQPRRSLDTRRAEQLMGWRARVAFEEGLGRTIDWYRTHRSPAPDLIGRVRKPA